MHESASPHTPTVGTALGEPDQLAYRVPRAAQILDMGERKVWELVHNGEIPSFTIGSARLVTRQALVDYINRRAAAA